MSLTSAVKKELVKVQPPTQGEQRAELAVILRLIGHISVTEHQRVIVDIEVDTEEIAHRLSQAFADLFHVPCRLTVLGADPAGPRRFLLHISEGTTRIIRQLNLADRRGRLIKGLPPSIIHGSKEELISAWRGAFLAHGSLADPARGSYLEITCPSHESAFALNGMAHRLGIGCKMRNSRGNYRVVIRDGRNIGILLDLIGAPGTYESWEEDRRLRGARREANRLANFDNANLKRSARAAVAATARVERAFEILESEDIPDHLAAAGELRMENRFASLDELGNLSDPILTKDAIAGRIRRLLDLADTRAHELGIPDTTDVAAQRYPQLLDSSAPPQARQDKS